MKLAIGQYDAPQIQQQPIAELNLYRSNIAVFGAPMSGKTTFIKTLLVRLHEDMNRLPEENIYIIDFGGNIGAYGNLRHVCACFDNSNEENIKRVFRTVENRLAENAAKLDSQSYYSVVSKTPEKAPPHILLIIENINAFLTDERYASYQDRLLRLCRDGLSKGLTIVITANETTGIHRILSNFGQKIAFEMPNESYYDIFNTRVQRPMRIPGRGVLNIESETYEFQCFMPFATKEDEESIRALVEHTAEYPNEHIMAAFDKDLTWDNFAQFCEKGATEALTVDDVIVGLDYYEHKPIAVNIAERKPIAIYGKRRFGKTNLLRLLLNGIKESEPDALFIYFDDGREQLKSFYGHREYHVSDNERHFTDAVALNSFLAEKGYIAAKTEGSMQMSVIKETPYTVFVMQSKMLFRSSGVASTILKRLINSDAKAQGFQLIFSDVPNISDLDIRRIFNDNIGVAFLLDNIGDFMADKSDKTAFGIMDANELKAEYAKCSIGDGYVYDVEADELQKLKFIKAEEAGD